MSQSDRAASKGLPATSELDASTTTYWNGGTPKASLDVGQRGPSALALQRVADRLHLDQAVPEYERVDAVFGESRWKSFAWVDAQHGSQ
jgi:hypothetical protein